MRNLLFVDLWDLKGGSQTQGGAGLGLSMGAGSGLGVGARGLGFHRGEQPVHSAPLDSWEWARPPTGS